MARSAIKQVDSTRRLRFGRRHNRWNFDRAQKLSENVDLTVDSVDLGEVGAFLKAAIITKGRPFVAAKKATDYFEMQVIRAFQDKITVWQILRRKSYKISDREWCSISKIRIYLKVPE